MAARSSIRLWLQRKLSIDDYILYFALVVHISLCSLYIADLPYLYRFFSVASGEKKPYPRLADDYRMMMKISFAVTAFFWTTLWAVKFSILFFFRKVMIGTAQMKRWWFVCVFTAACFVGCIISEFTSCETLAAFTRLGINE